MTKPLLILLVLYRIAETRGGTVQEANHFNPQR